MTKKIDVIDLFAGPGGLGEGFSGFVNKYQEHPFSVVMSVEKEPNAHSTLELRSFFRQFNGNPPDEYYQYLKGKLGREELFSRFPQQACSARNETLGGPKELGNESDDSVIYEYLKKIKRVDTLKVVIGGPPCQAYSLVGRARNRGVKEYVASEDDRHFLYKEYLKVLYSVQPEVFVMENVKGILSSKVDGQYIFPQVLEDLEDPGTALGKIGGKRYRIFPLGMDATDNLFGDAIRNSDYVVRSEEFGIPQARHRVILLGVQDDENIKYTGSMIKSNDEIYAQDVLNDLPVIRSGLSPASTDSSDVWLEVIHKSSELLKKEFKKIGLDASKIENSVIRAAKITSRGKPFIRRTKSLSINHPLKSWYEDQRLNGFTNHMSRGHKPEDLSRYFFCSNYAMQKDGISPKTGDFPRSLIPGHKNWNTGMFADRFKVQAKKRIASTVTSHISKDGHYFIHSDPAQCRSLTVREAARLQTFPDNYFFEGYQTAQYIQVGNAVPPYLAKQIAAKVYEILN